ncbi:TRAP transporter small permease [Salinarimonas soli]|uniref:TRAP transporter small permease protein n=1 Tax=Salinarimonas soli TaxID=1638099 RepID=A0A5B2VF97_9HYPH|nr:TRAP transporter small permease subunit [Salinarimonas soli]KAA2237624.1 TRAP transporter small permease subunit [Salinarimonas soli]
MIAVFLAFDRFLMRWTARAAMTFLVLAVAVSFYQVVTRFVFEQPSTWSEVTARALDIWMVYLGIAIAFRGGTMMAVDFLLDRTRGGARLVLLALIAGLTIGVLGVLVWSGVMMVQRTQFQMLAGIDNPFTGEGIPIALVYAAIPTGAALAIVGVIARAIESARETLAGAAVASDRTILEV